MTIAPATFTHMNPPAPSVRCAPAARQRPVDIRAVCLDVDDTLIDYGSSARSALRLLLDDLLGPTAPSSDEVWPLWQEITDHHSAAVVAGQLEHGAMRRLRTKAFFTSLGRSINDAEAARGEALRLVEMQRRWQLFDDALPCLDWLRAAGLKLAVITNATGPQHARLSDLGVSLFFDVITAAGEVGAAKPDPAIFHTTCRHLGVPPAQTLHIGDRLDLDAQAATNAGLHGVWLNRAAHPTPPSVPPPPGIPTLTTLNELPELLIDAPWHHPAAPIST